MEPQPSPLPNGRPVGHDPLRDHLDALLRDYVARLPSGQPVRVLPALLHAMPAIDALVAARVPRATIAATAERTIAPLAAARPGAARRISVPVERIYRAIALANVATGTSPELRAAGPTAQTPRRQTDHERGPGRSDTSPAIDVASRAAEAPPAPRGGCGPGVPAADVAPAGTPGPGAARAPRGVPAQRILGELRRQSESRRLPAREPFDPFNVETRPPAGGGPVEE
jgi:hypothetical protein